MYGPGLKLYTKVYRSGYLNPAYAIYLSLSVRILKSGVRSVLKLVCPNNKIWFTPCTEACLSKISDLVLRKLVCPNV